MTSPRDTQDSTWWTPEGTIRKGMKVFDADGTCLGAIAGVTGEEVFLEGGPGEFIVISQIDGVSEDAVLLAPRGDATFGLGAQP